MNDLNFAYVEKNSFVQPVYATTWESVTRVRPFARQSENQTENAIYLKRPDNFKNFVRMKRINISKR